MRRASSLEEEALGPEVLELWARTSEEHPQTVDGDDRPSFRVKSEQCLNNNRQTYVGKIMRVFHLGQRVLSSQKPLCGRAVSLSLAVLLECVGYRDRPGTNQVKRTT